MGVTSQTLTPQQVDHSSGSMQDVLDEIQDKGFVVSQVDKVVNWARTGSM